MKIETKVLGDTETVASVKTTVRGYLEAVRKAVRIIGYRRESIVKTQKLQGQVLKRRSGRLSAGVHTVFVDDTSSSSAITGIGPDLLYGKWHEEGGTFTVKEHLRTISQAFGRPIEPRQVMVRSHEMKLPQRSFLRSTAKEQARNDIATVKAEIAKVKQP